MAVVINKTLVKNLDPKNLYIWEEDAAGDTEFYVDGSFGSLLFNGGADVLPAELERTITFDVENGAKKGVLKEYYNGAWYATANENLTVYTHDLKIDGVQFKTVYGGAVMTRNQNTSSINTKDTKVSVTAVTGENGLDISINDAKVSTVYGGGAGVGSVLNGDVAINISNAKVSTIYGGGYKGAVVNGDVTISIDAAYSMKNIGKIYAGGYNAAVYGDAEVRFSGGDVSSFKGSVYGVGRGKDSFLSGSSTLTLADVTGKFKGTINDFDYVRFVGGTAVEFTKGQKSSMKNAVYDFVITNDTLKLNASMLTWNKSFSVGEVGITLDTDKSLSAGGVTVISSTKLNKANSFSTDWVSVYNSQEQKVYEDFYEVVYTPYDKKTKKGGTVTILDGASEVTLTENTVFEVPFAATNRAEKLTIAAGVTITGAVYMSGGNDTVILGEGSAIEGTLFLGSGNNKLYISGDLNPSIRVVGEDGDSNEVILTEDKSATISYNQFANITDFDFTLGDNASLAIDCRAFDVDAETIRTIKDQITADENKGAVVLIQTKGSPGELFSYDTDVDIFEQNNRAGENFSITEAPEYRFGEGEQLRHVYGTVTEDGFTYGADTVVLENGAEFTEGSSIELYSGNDTLILGTAVESEPVENAQLLAAASADEGPAVVINGTVDMGDGYDTVIVNADAEINGTVDMGAGNDTVIVDADAEINGTVDMGDGYDSVIVNADAAVTGGISNVEYINIYEDATLTANVANVAQESTRLEVIGGTLTGSVTASKVKLTDTTIHGTITADKVRAVGDVTLDGNVTGDIVGSSGDDTLTLKADTPFTSIDLYTGYNTLVAVGTITVGSVANVQGFRGVESGVLTVGETIEATGRVSFENITIDGNFTASLAEEDTVSLTGNVTFEHEAIMLSAVVASDDNDTLTFNGDTSFNSLAMGEGHDTVNFNTDATFARTDINWGTNGTKILNIGEGSVVSYGAGDAEEGYFTSAKDVENLGLSEITGAGTLYVYMPYNWTEEEIDAVKGEIEEAFKALAADTVKVIVEQAEYPVPKLVELPNTSNALFGTENSDWFQIYQSGDRKSLESDINLKDGNDKLSFADDMSWKVDGSAGTGAVDFGKGFDRVTTTEYKQGPKEGGVLPEPEPVPDSLSEITLSNAEDNLYIASSDALENVFYGISVEWYVGNFRFKTDADRTLSVLTDTEITTYGENEITDSDVKNKFVSSNLEFTADGNELTLKKGEVLEATGFTSVAFGDNDGVAGVNSKSRVTGADFNGLKVTATGSVKINGSAMIVDDLDNPKVSVKGDGVQGSLNGTQLSLEDGMAKLNGVTEVLVNGTTAVSSESGDTLRTASKAAATVKNKSEFTIGTVEDYTVGYVAAKASGTGVKGQFVDDETFKMSKGSKQATLQVKTVAFDDGKDSSVAFDVIKNGIKAGYSEYTVVVQQFAVVDKNAFTLSGDAYAWFNGNGDYTVRGDGAKGVFTGYGNFTLEGGKAWFEGGVTKLSMGGSDGINAQQVTAADFDGKTVTVDGVFDIFGNLAVVNNIDKPTVSVKGSGVRGTLSGTKLSLVNGMAMLNGVTEVIVDDKTAVSSESGDAILTASDVAASVAAVKAFTIGTENYKVTQDGTATVSGKGVTGMFTDADSFTLTSGTAKLEEIADVTIGSGKVTATGISEATAGTTNQVTVSEFNDLSTETYTGTVTTGTDTVKFDAATAEFTDARNVSSLAAGNLTGVLFDSVAFGEDGAAGTLKADGGIFNPGMTKEGTATAGFFNLTEDFVGVNGTRYAFSAFNPLGKNVTFADGNDVFAIYGFADEVTLSMGAGDDCLQLGVGTPWKMDFIDMGDGTDRLELFGNTQIYGDYTSIDAFADCFEDMNLEVMMAAPSQPDGVEVEVSVAYSGADFDGEMKKALTGKGVTLNNITFVNKES